MQSFFFRYLKFWMRPHSCDGEKIKPHVGFAGGGTAGAGRRAGEGWPGGHGSGADGGGLMARDVPGGGAQATLSSRVMGANNALN